MSAIERVREWQDANERENETEWKRMEFVRFSTLDLFPFFLHTSLTLCRLCATCLPYFRTEKVLVPRAPEEVLRPNEMGRPKKRASYVTKCRLPVGCFDLDSLRVETCWSSKNRTANSCRCNLLIDGMLHGFFGGLAVVPSLPGHQAKSLSKNTTTTTRRNWSNWLASKIHSRPASLFLLP